LTIESNVLFNKPNGWKARGSNPIARPTKIHRYVLLPLKRLNRENHEQLSITAKRKTKKRTSLVLSAKRASKEGDIHNALKERRTKEKEEPKRTPPLNRRYVFERSQIIK
jgi:hypothetical protein